MKISSNHKAARVWAERGIPVFPCLAGGKAPATEHGYKDATTDVATIDAWWSENPNYNIGGVPVAAGFCVIDVDRPEALAELETKFGALPTAFRVRTPKGGLHIWMRGELPKSLSQLADKVDTFGPGGYLVLPPSKTVLGPKTVDGHYQAIEGTWPPIETVPVTYSDPKNYKSKGLSSADLEVAAKVPLDLPANVERGRTFMKHQPMAKYGTIDDTTFLHCAELVDMNLSPAMVVEVMQEWYDATGGNNDGDRLLVVANSAFVNRENKVGVHAVEPPDVLFGELVANLPATVPGVAASGRFRILDEDAQDRLPDPSWLIRDLLPAKSTVMLYAPSGHWKTFLALDWSMTIASGLDKWGEVDRGPVVYIAAEGATGLGKYRRPAWKMLHGVFESVPFKIVDQMPWISRLDDVLELCDTILQEVGRPKMLVVDTLARAMMGLEENSAKDSGLAIEAIEIMKRKLDCTILALHHTRKDGDGYRGSGAILAGFDSVISLVANRENMTAEVWAKKHKDAETRNFPWRIKAEKLMDSLAFRMAVDADLAPGDHLKPADVGTVLRGLKVMDADDAVVAPVLVEELARFKLWDKKRVAREFATLAKCGKLRAFEVKAGGPYYCPSTDPETDEDPF